MFVKFLLFSRLRLIPNEPERISLRDGSKFRDPLGEPILFAQCRRLEEVLSSLVRVGADGIQIGLNVRAILSVKTTSFTFLTKLYRETTKQ